MLICRECGCKVKEERKTCNKCGSSLKDAIKINDDKKEKDIILSIILLSISFFSIIFYWFKGMLIMLAIFISLACFIASLFISKNKREIRFVVRVLDVTLLVMAIINIINLSNK